MSITQKHPAVLLLVFVAACGGGAEPEFLDVAALSGRYRVTLTLDPGSPSPRTCGQLEITIAAQISWQGLDCTIEEAGGLRDASDQEIILNETFAVAGGATAAREAYDFLVFMGTSDRPTSGWLGPCTGGPPSGGSGCTREHGSATWVRQ